MKIKQIVFCGLAATVAVLLPSTATAEYINVYPGPDAEWNYLYDFGDVEVGSSGVMIFQIENDATAGSDLTVDNVYIEEAGAFTITDAPSFPARVAPGESIYVEVAFAPGAEGLFEGVMRILSDASNIPPGTNIPYGLQGMGTVFEPPPDELMQAVMDAYAAGVADGTIYGLGNGNAPASHLRVFGNMLDAADDLIAAGDYAGACAQLDHAVVKSDGASSPPDFIGGTGVPALNAMLVDVMNALGC